MANDDAPGFLTLDSAYRVAVYAQDQGLLVEGVDMDNRYAVAYHQAAPRWVVCVKRLPVEQGAQSFEAHSLEELEAYMRITDLCRHPSIELAAALSENVITIRCTQCGLTFDANAYAANDPNAPLATQAANLLLYMRQAMQRLQLEEAKSAPRGSAASKGAHLEHGAAPVVGEHMSEQELADKLGIAVDVLRIMKHAPNWTEYNRACPECGTSEAECKPLDDDGFMLCIACGAQWNVTDSRSWTTHRKTGERYQAEE